MAHKKEFVWTENKVSLDYYRIVSGGIDPININFLILVYR